MNSPKIKPSLLVVLLAFGLSLLAFGLSKVIAGCGVSAQDKVPGCNTPVNNPTLSCGTGCEDSDTGDNVWNSYASIYSGITIYETAPGVGEVVDVRPENCYKNAYCIYDFYAGAACGYRQTPDPETGANNGCYGLAETNCYNWKVSEGSWAPDYTVYVDSCSL